MEETTRTTRYVYAFGNGKADGDGTMKELLGGKGAGLAEMSRTGVPVPPGFTLSTEACRVWRHEGKLAAEIERQFRAGLAGLETAAGRRLGDAKRPLLISVRSGAKFSMPGMMDTILNLGLNDATVEGLARETGDRRFALDSYRRLIQMFGKVVLDIDIEHFESVLHKEKKRVRAKLDVELDADALARVVEQYKGVVQKAVGRPFPDEPWSQLVQARDAVFRSWDNRRAVEYRRMENIPDDLGTAVNVQAMVFGNKGDDCATGVGFTRDPSSGEKTFYGEFLVNAQGEDVVAGIRTPRPIVEMERVLPRAFAELKRITGRLEQHYREVQDFEFTVEGGHLYMLQTRTGKRTGLAWVRTAVDMVDEGLITEEEALLRVAPSALDQLLHPVFEEGARAGHTIIGRGLPASPGAATGRVVFSADDAQARAEQGEQVLLVRKETSPDDIHGMKAARGVLTATGGMTSHAAVVGRQMGKPSVVGCGDLVVGSNGRARIGETDVGEGDWLSIDGVTGEVMAGRVPTTDSEVMRVVKGRMKPEKSIVFGYFQRILAWADKHRRLGIRCNCDTPEDAVIAVALGAEGIGLCRTEHMFFGEERLPLVEAMILADTTPDREAALKDLLPLQRKDFTGIFKAMGGRPVTIRTLDPPLHEFLPKREALMVERAQLEAAGKTRTKRFKEVEALLARVEQLHEFNPMLGHRGCRLGITYPEITRMQARAIFEAAASLAKRGQTVRPEVMIPLVGDVRELTGQTALVREVAQQVMAKQGVHFEYAVGTMIEVPRGALTAGRIAEHAEFFSFGTNDLTQMAYGISRDDIGKFLRAYVEQRIWEADPFATLDREGVGRLMRIAVDDGRSARPGLKVGICGEHGGDPDSITFCHQAGLDYVSCSPLRVPVARLAAARAALRDRA